MIPDETRHVRLTVTEETAADHVALLALAAAHAAVFDIYFAPLYQEAKRTAEATFERAGGVREFCSLDQEEHDALLDRATLAVCRLLVRLINDDSALSRVLTEVPQLFDQLGGQRGVDQFVEQDLSRTCGGDQIGPHNYDRYESQFTFAAASAILGLRYIARKREQRT